MIWPPMWRRIALEVRWSPLAGHLVCGPVVEVPTAFRTRTVGLEGGHPPVHEELETPHAACVL